jgi:predicted metalloprotease
LVIRSSPPFAEVFLDGRSLGVTPVTIRDLVPGPHRVLVKGRAGQPVDTLLQINPGHRLVRVRLDPGHIAFEGAFEEEFVEEFEEEEE